MRVLQATEDRADWGKNLFSNHDVTASQENLAEMQNLTNGGMSVPVTVVGKGTPNQKVVTGYDDAATLLKL